MLALAVAGPGPQPLHIPRGADFTLRVATSIAVNGKTLQFTVRHVSNTAFALRSVSTGDSSGVTFSVASEDSSVLAVGRYHYDVWVSEDGDRQPILATSTLFLDEGPDQFSDIIGTDVVSDASDGTLHFIQGAIVSAYVASADISALRVVKLSGAGSVAYADPEEATPVLGVTLTAATSGDRVSVATLGPVSDSSWAWTAGDPVFLGASGTLTQDATGLTRLTVIGRATSTTGLLVRVQPPVYLVS